MKRFIFLLFIIYCLLNVVPALAAKLELVSLTSEIGAGQEFHVDLMLDTESEEINAVEGKIFFSSKLLAIKEIRDGNSTVNFWIERPKIKETDSVSFSGIIPGGYKGVKGFIFSLVFRANNVGSGVIQVNGARVLLNDGKGTPVSIKVSPFEIYIQKGSDVKSNVESTIDNEPPEEFKPEIAQNPDIFSGKWFLVFATQDKGSGIDHYKVCEKIKTKCVIAESPYLLQNQNLDRKIFVMAIDKNGNERTVILPPKFAPWYQKPLVYISIIVAILVGVIIIRKWLWKDISARVRDILQ